MGNLFTTTVSSLPDSDYESVINYIRSLIYDNDPIRKIRTDAMLKAYISLVIPVLSFDISFDSVNEIFSSALSESNKLEIACRVSIIILSGMPEDFSYRNPVMSARRKFNVISMITRLEELLGSITGGKFASADSNEIYKILNSAELLTDAVDEAQL